MLSRREMLIAGGAGVACAPFASRTVAAQPRVRVDVMDLADDDPFFEKYAAAVKAMHSLPASDGRNWRRQAKIHADHCKHGELAFLYWHRHYIAFFEAICAQLIGDPGFALPYWNWSKKNGVIPAPFFDIDALNVEFWNDPGVYSSPNWGSVDTVGRRGLVKGQGVLADPARGGSFTTSSIDAIKRMPNEALFRGRLEGSPHNNGHVVAGATSSGKTGHIGDGLSPLDPIFWLHHCMVDRVWAEWQGAGNTSSAPAQNYAGDFVNKSGAAVSIAARDATSTTALGYTYDVLVPAAAVAAAPANAMVEAILPNLERSLVRNAAPVQLGGAEGKASAPLVETALKVSAPGLLEAIAGDRAFRELSVGRKPAVNIEEQRVLAHFAGVSPSDAKPDLLVNVFVNCPYLSPATGYSDPHYAGTFSFFGHAGHGAKGADFYIDITSPVRALAKEGKIKDQQITVQLMPLPVFKEGDSKTTFEIGRVEIIAV